VLFPQTSAVLTVHLAGLVELFQVHGQYQGFAASESQLTFVVASSQEVSPLGVLLRPFQQDELNSLIVQTPLCQEQQDDKAAIPLHKPESLIIVQFIPLVSMVTL